MPADSSCPCPKAQSPRRVEVRSTKDERVGRQGSRRDARRRVDISHRDVAYSRTSHCCSLKSKRRKCNSPPSWCSFSALRSITVVWQAGRLFCRLLLDERWRQKAFGQGWFRKCKKEWRIKVKMVVAAVHTTYSGWHLSDFYSPSGPDVSARRPVPAAAHRLPPFS